MKVKNKEREAKKINQKKKNEKKRAKEERINKKKKRRTPSCVGFADPSSKEFVNPALCAL